MTVVGTTGLRLLLRLLFGSSSFLACVLDLEVLDAQVQSHHIVNDELLLYDVLFGRPQYRQRLAEASARFSHLVSAERSSDDDQSHLEDNSDSFG